MSFLKKQVQSIPVKLPFGNQRELPHPDDIPFVKLGIIVGHEEKAPGAKSDIGSEYEYNSEIAHKIVKYAENMRNIKVVIIKRDGIGIEGAYQAAEKANCDAVIELHFNEYTGTVGGSETLCSSDLTDVEFAHEVHAKMCEAFNRNGMSRCVKVLSRDARGAVNVHSFTKGVNCLVEPFFGDFKADVELAKLNKEEYAKALVSGVLLWAAKNDFI